MVFTCGLDKKNATHVYIAFTFMHTFTTVQKGLLTLPCGACGVYTSPRHKRTNQSRAEPMYDGGALAWPTNITECVRPFIHEG